VIGGDAAHPQRQEASSPASFESARIATTKEEREAVYRLRYEVLISELDKGYLPSVDHAHRRVCDPQDEDRSVTIFYTGTPDAVTGSVRVQVWQPGEIPADIYRRFSLQLFPGIEDLQVAEVARLVVRPTVRGQLVVPALALSIFRHMLEGRGVLVGFAYCAPGLVRAFQGLGFRPYAGDVIPDEDGIRLPMIVLPADAAYFRRVGSPVASEVSRYFADHPDERARVQPIFDALRMTTPHYQLDPTSVWREVQQRFIAGGSERPALLQGLDDEEIRELSDQGITMDVPAGHPVMRQGLVEKELFLVLEGTFEGRSDGQRIAVMGEGDVFGEVSFFNDTGRRLFTVSALTPGRVLVLRRSFIEDLMSARPALASRLLFNLARILAARITSTLRGDGSEQHV
jgi:hypothetical protein